MKQTAVEWLIDKVIEYQQKDLKISKNFDRLLIANAKELEKEQIEDAFCDGVDDEYEHHINGSIRKNSEQYYDETYKNERGN